MGVLEDLQAADVRLADEVGALADEQATFLRDVATALGNVGTDPAAIEAVVADVNAKADQLAALADAQRAADPVAPAAPVAHEPLIQDPGQVPLGDQAAVQDVEPGPDGAASDAPAETPADAAPAE